ncbi:hypothetical protein GCM10009665_67380 [Kitasatospora nipponensis]|uniref:Uncharacterized protein n=1 Tax=Kitasatospora nipponensis TaxID=258049 RepID=A0ABN1WWC4_9ACTN
MVFGLHGVFGSSWLGRPWTFATYDTVDTHPLLLTAVAEWLPSSGQDGRLSRVDPAQPPRDQAQELATLLVERYLADPDGPPGLPELVRGVEDGARLPSAQRLGQLDQLLHTGRIHPQAPAPTAPAASAPPAPPTPLEPPAPPAPLEPEPEPAPAPPEEPSEQLSDRHLLDRLDALKDDWENFNAVLWHFKKAADRTAAERTALCAEVLAQRLYFYCSPGGREIGDELMIERAAWFFHWAVTREARDPVHREALGALLRLLALNSSPAERELLRRAVLETPEGRPAPDLPPELWQQLFRDLLPAEGYGIAPSC